MRKLSKYRKYVHQITHGRRFEGRWIVAYADEKLGWKSHNTLDNPGAGDYRMAANLHELAYFIRTYANVNAAVKAARRVYRDRLEQSPEFQVQ